MGVFEPVDAANVRMVQGGEELSFALEPREPLRVLSHRGQQHLDRDVAIQLRVARAIHLAHPTRPKQGDDFVRTEARTDGHRHGTLVVASRSSPMPPTPSSDTISYAPRRMPA